MFARGVGRVLGRAGALAGMLLLVGCLDAPPATVAPLASGPAATVPPTRTIPPAASPTRPPTFTALPAATATPLAATATVPPATPAALPATATAVAPAASASPTRLTLALLEGTPTLTAPQTPTPPEQDPRLAAALAAMALLQTYHYTATIQVFAGGHNLQGTREGDYRAPTSVRWATMVDGITSTAVLSGSLYFVTVGGQEWTPMPRADQERLRELPWLALAQGRDVREVSRDPPSDPDPAVQLAFTLPLDALPLEAHPWQLAQANVWLGVTDHRVRAFKLFAQSPTYETTERFFLSAYNAPVQIALPAATTLPTGLAGRLLYTHREPGQTTLGELHLRDLAAGGDDILSDAPGTVDGAAWSPDGMQVLSSVSDHLYLLNVSGGPAANLGRGSMPAWSPAGSAVLFLRGSGTRRAVWMADPQMNDPHRVGDYLVEQGDWAPDGSQILFSGWLPGGGGAAALPQLFVTDAQGGAVHALPAVSGGAAEARWSPDGTRIALISGGHLALVDAGGSRLTVLNATGTDAAPVWSPDGTTLIYGHRDSPAGPQRLLFQSPDGGPAQPLTPGDDVPLDWQ